MREVNTVRERDRLTGLLETLDLMLDQEKILGSPQEDIDHIQENIDFVKAELKVIEDALNSAE